jgi:hypothetical protein
VQFDEGSHNCVVGGSFIVVKIDDATIAQIHQQTNKSIWTLMNDDVFQFGK